MDHPNVVKFYAWDKIKKRIKGVNQRYLCYAMEYLEVCYTLEDILSRLRIFSHLKLQCT